MPRKHIGIIQKGKNAGRLRKGYRFNGKRTKTGLPVIVKVHQNQRRQQGGYDRGPVEDTAPLDDIPPPPQMPRLRRQNAVDGQRALINARREQRERQRLRAQAAVERMRNRNQQRAPRN